MAPSADHNTFLFSPLSHPTQQHHHHQQQQQHQQTGGHYTAHALQADGRWYRFNDAAVTHVPGGAQQVGRERAYLLAYQRVA